MTLEEPGFLMLDGHLHPLVLHFPIALLLVVAVLDVLHRPLDIAARSSLSN